MQPFLERHRQLYGKVPRQSAWDGGFASAANLSWAKEQGVQDVAFSKKCGLTVESMVRSSWVYKQLKRFRAGIEGCIGTLKHTFGLHRCTWKSRRRAHACRLLRRVKRIDRGAAGVRFNRLQFKVSDGH